MCRTFGKVLISLLVTGLFANHVGQRSRVSGTSPTAETANQSANSAPDLCSGEDTLAYCATCTWSAGGTSLPIAAASASEASLRYVRRCSEQWLVVLDMCKILQGEGHFLRRLRCALGRTGRSWHLAQGCASSLAKEPSSQVAPKAGQRQNGGRTADAGASKCPGSGKSQGKDNPTGGTGAERGHATADSRAGSRQSTSGTTGGDDGAQGGTAGGAQIRLGGARSECSVDQSQSNAQGCGISSELPEAVSHPQGEKGGIPCRVAEVLGRFAGKPAGTAGGEEVGHGGVCGDGKHAAGHHGIGSRAGIANGGERHQAGNQAGGYGHKRGVGEADLAAQCASLRADGQWGLACDRKASRGRPDIDSDHGTGATIDRGDQESQIARQQGGGPREDAAEKKQRRDGGSCHFGRRAGFMICPQRSRKGTCGLLLPWTLLHSVTAEPDFVSPQMAQQIAVHAVYKLAAMEQGCWVAEMDPRIQPYSRGPSPRTSSRGLETEEPTFQEGSCSMESVAAAPPDVVGSRFGGLRKIFDGMDLKSCLRQGVQGVQSVAKHFLNNSDRSRLLAFDAQSQHVQPWVSTAPSPPPPLTSTVSSRRWTVSVAEQFGDHAAVSPFELEFQHAQQFTGNASTTQSGGALMQPVPLLVGVELPPRTPPSRRRRTVSFAERLVEEVPPLSTATWSQHVQRSAGTASSKQHVEAQSQHVQLRVSTAKFPPATPVPQGRTASATETPVALVPCSSPGGLLPRGRPPEMPQGSGGHTALRMTLAAAVHVVPPELDRPELRNLPLASFKWYSGCRATGADHDGAHWAKYALMTTSDHLQVRPLPIGWSLNEVIAVSVHSRVRAIRILQQRLEALPSLQIVATLSSDLDGGLVMPVDYRRVQGRICTMALVPGQNAAEVNALGTECPLMRRPREAHVLSEPNGQPFVRLRGGVDMPEFLRGAPFAPPTLPEEVVTLGGTDHEADEASHLQTALLQQVGRAGVSPKADSCRLVERRDLCPVSATGGVAVVPVPEVHILEPTERQMIAAEGINVLPPEFRDEHVFTAPTSRFKYGQAGREHFGRFTVFDTHRHATVARGAANTDLHTLVAQAIVDAPFEVATVRILTSPLNNLPRPQFVLHEAGRPPYCMPVPWDLRSTHGVIRTTEHRGGQPLLDAVRLVSATLVSEPSLIQCYEQHELFVRDAIGPVFGNLPGSLTQAQFFDVDRLPGTPFVTQRISAPILVGSSQLQEGTTRTTTWVQAITVPPALPILRLVLFRGSIAATADMNPPYRHVDRVLAHLITQISAMQPLTDNSVIVAAATQPPALGYLQEVVLVISDSRSTVPVVWDARPIGGGLQVLSQDVGATSDGTLGPAWREDGWSLAINGVPVRHMARALQAGDYLQPFHGTSPHPSVPQGHIFQLCPDLAPLAWPLWVREGGLPMTTFSTLYPRLVEVLRLRREATGAAYRAAGFASVQGPSHGTLHLHFADPAVPSIQAIADAMSRLDHPPPWADVLKTAVLWPETAVCSTSTTGLTGHTVLVPAPFFPEQHFVILVQANPGLLEGLPGEVIAQLMPRRSLASGDVLYLSRDPGRAPEPESDNEEEFAVLLQKPAVHHRRCVQRSSIPTPFGRRHIPADQPAQPSQYPEESAVMRPLPEAPVPMRIELDACIPRREATGVHERPMHLPIPREAVGVAFEHTDLCHFRCAVPETAKMHAAARALLRDVPEAERSDPPEALLFFVDGSYKAPSASWAVACFVYQRARWCWWGYMADVVAPPFESADAFAGELFGQLVALCAGAQADVPFAICYDCESAACVAQGQTAKCADDVLRRAVVSVTAYLRAKGRTPGFHHTKAHTGNPGNELADHLAKSVLGYSSGAVVRPDNHFVDFILEGAFDWLWFFPAVAATSSLPPLRDDSTTAPSPVFATIHVHRQPVLWAPPESKAASRTFTLRCKVATYNTLSCASNLQRQCLQSFQEEHSLAIFGLQECRSYVAPVHRVGSILRFASAPVEGQFGCQLWFNVSARFGWVVSSFQLAYQHPRLLVVYAKWDDCQLAVFSGHCPTATAPAAERSSWWSLVRSRLQALPAHTAPILLLDANARFDLQEDAEVARTPNAEALEALTREFGMQRTRAYDTNGMTRRSWRPPAGSAATAACLDYVLWPSIWSEGVQDAGILPIVDEHVDIDHQPIAVNTQLRLRVEKRASPQIDRDAICTAEGRNQLCRLFERAPPILWGVSVDDHLGELNTYLQQGIAAMFPVAKQRPRKPTLSDRTWALLHLKRQQRRCFRRQRLLFAKWTLAQCFAAWRRSPHRCADGWRVKAFDQVAARHMSIMRRLTLEARKAQREDDAEFTRRMFQEARHQGPTALAQQVRAVLRRGRNPRVAALSVELHTTTGKLSDPADVKAAFAEHFGKAEGATPQPLASLFDSPSPAQAEDVHLEDIPSLARLVAAFASLKPRKATGISCLPAEIYSQCPLPAAMVHMSLLLKICSRQRFPVLWSGLLACALPKPGKPPDRVEGYRSVALVEPAAKGVFKALRPVLSEGYETVALATIGGARKGHPADLAALSTQMHLSRLKREGRSGSVLYLDGASAFYAVHREHLFSADLAALRGHIAQLELEPEVRSRVEAAVSDKGALDRAGIPTDTQRVLRAAFATTWFVVDTQQEIVQATARGTTPGSPLADLLYQFVSEVAVRCLAQHLRDEGVAAGLTTQGRVCHALPQSWLDDVALLLEAPDAASVAGCTARAMSLAHQYLALTGVCVNYAAGKTEAIVLLAGRGVQAARKALFLDQAGCIAVHLPGGDCRQLRCVTQYTHLGTTREHTASSLAAISKREQQTREVLQPFRRRIMANHALSRPERQELFKSMILAKFLHGLGTLEMSGQQAYGTFVAKYMGLVRSVVRPLYGVPCRRLTDDQVCSLLAVVTPREAADIAVMRTWACVAKRGDDYLHGCLHGSHWEKEAWQAVARVAKVAGDPALSAFARNQDQPAGLQGFPLSPRQARNMLRHFRRACVLGRASVCESALKKARAHEAADQKGLVYMRVECDRLYRASCFRCRHCALVFDSGAALGSHLSKVHSHAAPAAFGFGTACEVCRKQFWSTGRLREHLRKAKGCSRVYAEADWMPSQPVEILASQQVPVTALVGPAPWWALQNFDEVADHTVSPAHPDPLVSVSSLTSLHQLPPFLRTWMQAVESGWEPPLFLPRLEVGTVPALAVTIAEALGQNTTARVLQSGELAAVVSWDAVLCGPSKEIREAFLTFWADL